MIIQFIVSLFATLSFAELFGAPKKELFFCGLTGAIGWVVYVIGLNSNMGTVLANLTATFALTVFSRILSAIRRNPVTVYLIAGIFPLVHGANLRYLCSLMEQELSRGKGMILVSPEYANYASVMEMLRTGSKYPLLHARADGNEEAEEVERREIFLGLLE